MKEEPLTSIVQMQSYNITKTGPAQRVMSHAKNVFRGVQPLTGPTRSGMNSSRNPTFAKMKKKPRSVTMFGASHKGKSSTNAFHFKRS